MDYENNFQELLNETHRLFILTFLERQQAVVSALLAAKEK
jgi:hypothetical protein